MGWVIAAMAVQLIGQVALLKLQTHWMVPSEYGKLNIIMSITQFLQLVVFMPLLQGAGRMASQAPSTLESFKLVRGVFRNIWIIIAVLCAVAFAWCVVLGNWQRAWLIVLAAILLWQEVTREYWLSIAHIDRRRKSTALFRSLDVISKLGLLWLIFEIVGSSVALVLLGSCLAMVIVIRAVGVTLRRSYTDINAVSFPKEREIFKKILSFAIPFGTVSIFTWAQAWADRWILLAMMGEASVGHYAAAMQVANMSFSAIAGLFITFAAPILYKFSSSHDRSSKKSILKIIGLSYLVYLITSLLLVLIFFIFGEFILQLFLANQYIGEARSILLGLVIGCAMVGLSQLQSLSLMVAGHPKFLIMPNVVSALLGMVLSVILVPIHGLEGAMASFILAGMFRLLLLIYSEFKAWKE